MTGCKDSFSKWGNKKRSKEVTSYGLRVLFVKCNKLGISKDLGILIFFVIDLKKNQMTKPVTLPLTDSCHP